MEFKIIYLIVAIISFFAYTINIIDTCVNYDFPAGKPTISIVG